MVNDEFRRDRRRQIFLTVAGLGIGLVAAGLVALLINNVIQPQMQVETHDLVKYSGDTFNVWYHDGSPYVGERSNFVATLSTELDELLGLLGVDKSDIPLPIDVIVHDTPQMLQETTLRRKSPNATYSFYAMIDVVHGEDPYQRLAELVLAFGWGNCHSQLLYWGMLLNILEPARNFDVALSAVPPRLFYSLDDLLKLEGTDTFAETLYERYQSPFSPRLAMGSLEGMAEFRAMFTQAGPEAHEDSLPFIEAASLVHYLIQCSGGLQAFREIWGPGTTEAQIDKLACGSLEGLADQWTSAIQSTNVQDDDYRYYRARFLYEAGDVEDAARITSAWPPGDLPSTKSILAVRTQLAVGDLSSASEYATSAGDDVRETLEGWVSTYSGWQSVTNGEFTVMGRMTDDELSDRIAQVQDAYDQVVNTLGFKTGELPGHVTAFFYDTAADRDTGSSILSFDDADRTLWHMGPQDNLIGVFARSLPSYVTGKDTGSTLLERGLSAALTMGKDELVDDGCAILRDGQWTPMWRIGLGGTPERLLNTETGLMVQYILDRYGADALRDLWVATAKIGGGQSLETAFRSVLDTSRSDIEETIVDTVLVCE